MFFEPWCKQYDVNGKPSTNGKRRHKQAYLYYGFCQLNLYGEKVCKKRIQNCSSMQNETFTGTHRSFHLCNSQKNSPTQK